MLSSGSAMLAPCLVLLTGLLGGCVWTVEERDILRPPHISEQFEKIPNRQNYVYGRGLGTVEFLTCAIVADDGTSLRGFLVRPAQGDALANLIFLHGSQGVMSRSREMIAMIVDAFHVNILAIDYRGYGYSSGAPSIEATRRDTREIYDWLAADPARHQNRPIVAFGYSLGSAYALDLAAHRPVAGVILIAPFTTAAEFCERLSFGLLRFQAGDSLTGVDGQPIDNAAKVTCPLLVLHPSHDQIVPLEMGERIFEAAGARWKSFAVMPHSDHLRLCFRCSPVMQSIQDFLDVVSLSTGRGQLATMPGNRCVSTGCSARPQKFANLSGDTRLP